MNEITKPETTLLAWNGERLRNTAEEAMRILLPMFALFPQMKIEEPTMALYIDMLRDIHPERLEKAVRRCMAECKFMPTVADIRERYEEDRKIKRVDTSWKDRPNWPPPEATKLDQPSREERLERLRQTKDWSARYEH